MTSVGITMTTTPIITTVTESGIINAIIPEIEKLKPIKCLWKVMLTISR